MCSRTLDESPIPPHNSQRRESITNGMDDPDLAILRPKDESISASSINLMAKLILIGCLLGISLPLVVSGCSSNKISEVQASSLQAQPPQASGDNQPTGHPKSIELDLFNKAIQRAAKAAGFSQNAESPATWSQIANLWEEAIDLMEALPESSPNYSIAQQKVIEYQASLKYAQKNADTGLPEQISQDGGGLGDTLAVFESRYGPSSGRGIGKGFRCNTLTSACEVMAMFIGDLAIQVELLLDHPVSQTQAIQMAAPLLPSDAKQLEAWNVNEEIHLIRYESANLAKVFPTDNNPGILKVLVEHNPFQPNQAFRIIISVGGDETL